MNPYYSDRYITILHEDCRNIMPSLGGLVVTDPPYNIGYHYSNYTDNLKKEEYQDLLGVSCRTPSVIIHYIEDLFELSWVLEEIPKKVVAWVYPSNTARQWRGVAWFGTPDPDFTSLGQEYKNPNDKRIKKLIQQGRRARLYDWWEVNQVKNVSTIKTEHPCQIPPIITDRILIATPAVVTIDPFLGSGTTAVSALKQCRKFIGIEKEERYCEISANRCIAQVVKMLQEGTY